MLINRNRGDTIIEVMLAITIFSLIIVSSLAIMNQGLYTAQRSLEISLVRSQIDSQAEALRFLNSSYINSFRGEDTDYGTTPASEWQKIVSDPTNLVNSVSDFGAVGTSCPSPVSQSFAINSKRATLYTNSISRASTFSRIVYDTNDIITSVQGIWIEAFRSSANNHSGYVDFHIRACWDSPGQSTPVTLGTIVRLYEPRD